IVVPAQGTPLGDLYGRGVHAFYAHQYEEAHEYLSMAIDQGLEDPRAYYFRGLVYRATGRPDEATDDFEKGARIEATASAQLFDVSRALQRIQGPTRLEIEDHRSQARVALRGQQVQRAKARYEGLQQAEQEGALLQSPQRDPVPALPRAERDEDEGVDPFS